MIFINFKEIYPVVADNQLRAEYGDNYNSIKQAFREGDIYEFVFSLLKNPAKNFYWSTVTEEQVNSTVIRFSSVFEWQKYKQVYKFDDDLWDLIQSVRSLEINSAVFEAMPFPTFYVDRVFENNLHGCVVSYGKERGDNYLKLVFLSEKSVSYFLLPLNEDYEGRTLEDIIHSYIPDDSVNWYASNIRSVLNAVVYLCTETPDVNTDYIDAPSPIQKVKNKRKPKKIGVSKVGSRIGRMIRDSQNVHKSASGTGTGSPKSPHIRKAHYHSFWTGSGENRKLVVKFLSPVLVHGKDLEENSIPTIRIKSKS